MRQREYNNEQDRKGERDIEGAREDKKSKIKMDKRQY